jgi:hypothetical protein
MNHRLSAPSLNVTWRAFGRLALAVCTSLVVAQHGYAVPNRSADAKASLGQPAGRAALERSDPDIDQGCRANMGRCFLLSAQQQINCLALVANDGACRGSKISSVMQRRAELGASNRESLSVQRCLNRVDAALGGWMMAQKPRSAPNSFGDGPPTADERLIDSSLQLEMASDDFNHPSVSGIEAILSSCATLETR